MQCILQTLQGQLLDFHILTAFLKLERELFPLISEGINYQIFGALKNRDSVVWYTELTRGILNCEVFLRLQLLSSSNWNTSLKVFRSSAIYNFIHFYSHFSYTSIVNRYSFWLLWKLINTADWSQHLCRFWSESIIWGNT